MRPVFGQRPCPACKGVGALYGAACGTCKGTGLDTPKPPLPAPKPEADQPPTTGGSVRHRPPSAPTGDDRVAPRDANPQPNVDACRARHSNIAIAAHYLTQGGIGAYDAVYQTECPWCGFTRRNTRLADTVFRLKGRGWNIETLESPGRLASYRLVDD